MTEDTTNPLNKGNPKRRNAGAALARINGTRVPYTRSAEFSPRRIRHHGARRYPRGAHRDPRHPVHTEPGFLVSRPGGITTTIGAVIEPGVSPGTGRSDVWQGALSLRSRARVHVVRHAESRIWPRGERLRRRAATQLTRYCTKAVVWAPLAGALVYHVTADELSILYGAK